MKHRIITQIKSKHDLTKLLASKIANSDKWLVLREDKHGVHLETPEENDLVLFAFFFHTHPEVHEAVKRMLEIIRKHNAN